VVIPLIQPLTQATTHTATPSLSWSAAWSRWFNGHSLNGYALYGIPILWVGRAGKIGEAIAGLAVIIDIIGPERLRQAGTKIEQAVDTKQVTTETWKRIRGIIRTPLKLIFGETRLIRNAGRRATPTGREAHTQNPITAALTQTLAIIGVLAAILAVVALATGFDAALAYGLIQAGHPIYPHILPGPWPLNWLIESVIYVIAGYLAIYALAAIALGIAIIAQGIWKALGWAIVHLLLLPVAAVLEQVTIIKPLALVLFLISFHFDLLAS
jgi:hypothetical protein